MNLEVPGASLLFLPQPLSLVLVVGHRVDAGEAGFDLAWRQATAVVLGADLHPLVPCAGGTSGARQYDGGYWEKQFRYPSDLRGPNRIVCRYLQIQSTSKPCQLAPHRRSEILSERLFNLTAPTPYVTNAVAAKLDGFDKAFTQADKNNDDKPSQGVVKVAWSTYTRNPRS